jgi:hypothetical protein
VDDTAVQKTKALLNNQEQVQVMVERNYALAQEYFSLEVLERKLGEIIATF